MKASTAVKTIWESSWILLNSDEYDESEREIAEGYLGGTFGYNDILPCAGMAVLTSPYSAALMAVLSINLSLLSFTNNTMAALTSPNEA